jgi:hypothetical protein
MARWSAVVALVLLALAAGCTKLPKSTSLLTSAETSDHVALEVFFARFPLESTTVAQALWSSVDEQAIELDSRRRLQANGFLVGQVGGQLPAPIVDLLHVSDDAPVPTVAQTTVIDTAKPPAVHRKLIDVFQYDMPNHIVVMGERERQARLIVLYRDEADGGAVRGWPFKNAKGSLVTKVIPQSDGRVKLDIVPEIEYGESRRDIKPDEGGAFRMLYTPPTKTFESLRVSATLSPGEVLVFGCQPDRPGSLGQQFFTERQSDVLNQTVVLIRVLRGKSDELFAHQPLETE